MMHLILKRDGREYIAQPLGEKAITIGRSPASTLQLVDSTISRKHCTIRRRGSRIEIVDNSRNGTFVNNTRVGTVSVAAGDDIALGPWRASIEKRPASSAVTVVEHRESTNILSYDDVAKRLCEETLALTIVTPDQSPMRRTISRTSIVIGSGALSDVIVADDYVSREHCRLSFSKDVLLLMDLGSTNGTFVDGTRIDRVALSCEGTFTIGETVIRYRRETAEHELRPSEAEALGAMIGKTRPMREVFALIEKIAPTHLPVYIHGESGTGKELAAREIHRLSTRHGKPFVAVNCGALPAGIIESTLFGHERGAFTGAVERHAGVFEQADGGTLFLDEIGEMDVGLQTRLLRILEDGRIRRLGAREETSIDIRLITATNRDLKTLVRSGDFREDLFYRIYVIALHLASLRQRAGDIPLLAQHFLCISSPRKRSARFSEGALAKLIKYSWPGNVRELKNTITRAAVEASGDVIEAKHIAFIGAPQSSSIRTPINEQERETILTALRTTRGNQIRAAKMLGIARSTLAFKIVKYEIDLDDCI